MIVFKRIFKLCWLIVASLGVVVPAMAGVTTYTFTSANWASTVQGSATDRQTDGWTCNLAGAEYVAARTDAAGRMMYAGVAVRTGYSGAGATSVRSFTDVRKVTINYCQNSSKGRGVIHVEVGNVHDSIVVNRPQGSGQGVYNRDTTLTLPQMSSGHVRFWVTCSENAIYVHQLAIRAAEGGSTPFTTATYQLVTDASQLCDSDQIMLGVPLAGKLMGYFDETVSQNNIHAIAGRFAANGQTATPNDNAIYTLRQARIHDSIDCWYIQDELRYEEAYLVASGGQSKNRLALWNHLVDRDTYGDYGYWDIQVAPTGEATIHNLGRSAATYLQYNAQNNPTLFACYKVQGSQTPVVIYRRVAALGDIQAIQAPMVNFGTLLPEDGGTATRTIEVNANRLTADIRVSIDNPQFSLSDTLLDRDGDKLTLTCLATVPGRYVATLTLASDSIVTTVPVHATLAARLTIAEAVHQPDYSQVYLQPVEVTKKYDTYVFVRDATGSMLLYDQGDGTGKRYAANVVSGDTLKSVAGRFLNYFGVPELVPISSFSTVKGHAPAVPEKLEGQLDSTWVCRYVEADSVVITDQSSILGLTEEPLTVVDAFLTGMTLNELEKVSGIVMISWDELQLWLVSEGPCGEPVPDALDNQKPQGGALKVVRDGHILIMREGAIYTIIGTRYY